MKPVDYTGEQFGNVKVISLDSDLSRLKKSSQFHQLCLACGKTWVGRVDKRKNTCGCGQGWFREKNPPQLKRFKSWKSSRLKDGKWEWNLEYEDLVFPTHCPLLGLELNYSRGRGQANENASLDRIDSSLGYVRGNVWIISYYANRIKNSASLEELELIVTNWKNLLTKN